MGIIGKYCLALICGVFLVFFVVDFSLAKPQGGVATYGNVTINQNPGNNISTLITQTSQKGIIDWQSFSIANYEHVHFDQPNAAAITLNRVLGGDVSNIFGKLTATGQVFIINPSGILFGPNAVVDVAGLIATTANMSNENFLKGKYLFVQGPNNNAKIINQGYIKVANSGLAALVAPSIENSGIIEANFGKVILGATPSTSTFVIDFYGDDLINFTIPTDVNENTNTSILQSGKIIAHGGKVLLTVNSAKNIVDGVINMSGVIEADTVGVKTGNVILQGGSKGEIDVTGKITARGNQAGEIGGIVKITGDRAGLFFGAVIDVSGKNGGGKVLIGADYQNGILMPAAEMTYIDEGATILANALDMGNGGHVVAWSNGSTRFYGTVEAKGGLAGGNGGFFETSSNKWIDVNYAKADLTAPNGTVGTWLIDPFFDISIINGTPASGTGWTSILGVWNYTPPGPSSILFDSSILAQLATADVVISTVNIFGTQAGNITFGSGATINYGGPQRSLIIAAGNDITVGASTVISGNLNLSLGAVNNISINSGATISGTNLVLSLAAGGSVTISAPLSVGTFEVLGGALRFNVAGSPAVSTTTLQAYATPVTLLNNTTLISGGEIAFLSTIDGPFSLTLSASLVGLASSIGANSPLSSLTINAANTVLNASRVQTIGSQIYNGQLIFTTSSSLTGSGSLVFNHGIISPFGLTLNAGNGNILFGGSGVGNFIVPLGNLEIINANNVTSEVPIFTRSFSEIGGTGTTSFALLFVGSGGFGDYVPGTGNGLATIITNNVIGNIDVGSLALSTEAANLNGYLGGQLAPNGIQNILILNTILPNTHFWGGMDMLLFSNGLMTIAELQVSEIRDQLQKEMEPWVQDITSVDYNSGVLPFGTNTNADYLPMISPFIGCD